MSPSSEDPQGQMPAGITLPTQRSWHSRSRGAMRSQPTDNGLRRSPRLGDLLAQRGQSRQGWPVMGQGVQSKTARQDVPRRPLLGNAQRLPMA